MSDLLSEYLRLERELLLASGDADFDVIADQMDPIWYALTDAERNELNDARKVEAT